MQPQPNILLIVCDQLRYDSVGFNGANAVLGAPVPTPQLDALAARSLVFDNAFTALPTCCPARQAMLAGVRPERFGALWNYDITSQVASLTPAAPTWPAALAAAGYQMAYVGKWHVSPRYTPRDFGYQTYIGEEDYHRWRAAHYPQAAGAPEDLFGGEDPLPLAASSTHWLAAHATEQLQRLTAAGGPWHLRLDFPQPHPPATPCAPFAARFAAKRLAPWPSFADDFSEKPYIQRQQLVSWGIEDYSWEKWQPYAARYFAIIAQLDDAIGGLLRALEASGAADNTLILFTADHGDMCGSHRMMDKHYVLYDDVVHVPLLLYAPGCAPRRVRGFVNNCLDMAPTLLEAAGLPPLPAADGLSLAGLLGGQSEDFLPGQDSDPIWGRDGDGLPDCALSTLNGQQFGLYSQRMLRTADWKYIWNLTDTDELYDLARDPWELHNLARRPECAERLRTMRHRLYRLLQAQDPDIVKNPVVARQLLEDRKL